MSENRKKRFYFCEVDDSNNNVDLIDANITFQKWGDLMMQSASLSYILFFPQTNAKE